ncbi:hypothetical protein ET33_12065 [Paenibacillus tyrfis]|uniref:Uncharacterized protein n=1 Tax=Paenibacillus tyrfis TaxID=1501230 RepID=A0A081NZX1_9BACL|nr:hypothetical protein ET33_12065 [Paenibacillus tyrfis]
MRITSWLRPNPTSGFEFEADSKLHYIVPNGRFDLKRFFVCAFFERYRIYKFSAKLNKFYITRKTSAKPRSLIHE